jgi:uncharacterized cupredoxin-like copper-binding protein
VRALAIVACTAALVLLLGMPAASAAPPQRMQVTEDEWSLVFSRLRMRPGPALIEVFNIGQDAHNVVMQLNAKGAKPLATDKLYHFERTTLKVKLQKGTYTLWCSLPNHRERGMVAKLRVG